MAQLHHQEYLRGKKAICPIPGTVVVVVATNDPCLSIREILTSFGPGFGLAMASPVPRANLAFTWNMGQDGRKRHRTSTPRNSQRLCFPEPGGRDRHRERHLHTQHAGTKPGRRYHRFFLPRRLPCQTADLPGGRKGAEVRTGITRISEPSVPTIAASSIGVVRGSVETATAMRLSSDSLISANHQFSAVFSGKDAEIADGDRRSNET